MPVLTQQGDLDARCGLFGDRVEGVAQQVDQHLFQADGVATHPGRLARVLLDVHGAVAQARRQQLQGLVHHAAELQGLAQAARALPGVGLQVGGEGGHALQQFVVAAEGIARLFQLPVVEHQAQAAQVHVQGGQRLVDLVGEGGGHLPQGRELGRLHQAILGGAQGGGTLFHQAFEFVVALPAQACQAPALVQEQGEEEQRQPQPAGGQAGVAGGAGDVLRAMQQVQGPAFAGQCLGFPQVVGLAVGPLHPDQAAAVAEVVEGTVHQRRQRLVVLAGGGQLGAARHRSVPARGSAIAAGWR